MREPVAQSPRIITLLTDFGTRDAFVGMMKGVLLSVCPDALLVDLTHEIPPADIRAGAFSLRWAAPYFPPGTVHLAVVDPGVGGTRRPLVLRGAAACFVGPDNGLLWPAASRDGEPEAWEIDPRALGRPISATFHGRDLFAPVAARLAAGEMPEQLGLSISDPVRFDWPRPRREGNIVHGEVMYIDRFGNAITNFGPEELRSPTEQLSDWIVAGRQLRGPCAHYGAVPIGEPVIVLGSAGLYEVAVNQGDAAMSLGLTVGMPVTVRIE